jgi:hypothetical protein
MRVEQRELAGRSAEGDVGEASDYSTTQADVSAKRINVAVVCADQDRNNPHTCLPSEKVAGRIAAAGSCSPQGAAHHPTPPCLLDDLSILSCHGQHTCKKKCV